MEKISSILPGSSRVTSVDMKEASPVRSGTPGFGRAEAQAGRERPTADAIKQASEAQTEMHDWRTKDVKHAAIAKDLSDKFFAKNKVDVEEGFGSVGQERGVTIASASKAQRARDDFEESEPMAADIESSISNVESRQQPSGLHPKGSFINYAA